jgi:hypothetical protein
VRYRLELVDDEAEAALTLRLRYLTDCKMDVEAVKVREALLSLEQRTLMLALPADVGEDVWDIRAGGTTILFGDHRKSDTLTKCAILDVFATPVDVPWEQRRRAAQKLLRWRLRQV